MAAEKDAKKSTKVEPISTANKGGNLVESPTTGATSHVYRADMGESLPPQGTLLGDKK